LRREPADLDKIEAERFDFGQHAVKRRPVEKAGEDGVGALVLRRQRRERGEHRGTEAAVDSDRIQDGR
jgi:hypothetical protein